MPKLKGIFYKTRTVLGMDTLKGQLYLVLITSALIPLILIGTQSFYSIYSILENKIQKGVEINLQQVRLSLENTLDTLNIDSQQFLFTGIIGQDIQKLMNTTDTFEKAQLTTTITQNMNIFNASNPLIGLNFFYFPDSHKMMFENLITRSFDLNLLPVLARSGDVIYNGSHKTLYKYNDSHVFSIIRKVNWQNSTAEPTVLIYIETNIKVFQQILNQEQYGMNAFHILIDQDDHIAYSGRPDLFPVGELYKSKAQQQYYSFTTASKLGWKVAVFVNKDDYNQEIRKWTSRSILIGFLSLAISMLLAFQLWRLVIRPLLKIRKGISTLIETDKDMSYIGLKEFDHFIQHFNIMRQEIKDLIDKVGSEAKIRQEIEVEKLMAQINPHFLYNTLNTAQWLARMKGQHEIDRFLTLFTRILKYNLAKDGIMVTVSKEIQAIQDYIELQKIRYDYPFDVRILVEEQAEDFLLPRFILQPIVENALYHGSQDTGAMIEVTVGLANNQLLIRISDNGAGMDDDQVEKILTGGLLEKDQVGLGIGLNYVAKVMRSYFGEQSRMDISSTIGQGTVVDLTIPAWLKEKEND
jgi:two-component system sensor histidine kinase YesM